MKKIELARELQCAPSTITALLATGMPIESDGSLDRKRCLEWISRFTSGVNGGWGSGRRGLSIEERAKVLLRGEKNQSAPSKVKQPRPAAAPLPVKVPQALPDESRQAVIDALRQIVSVKETLNFAMVARSIGCSLEQAQALARWHVVAGACAIEVIDVEDLEHLPEPTTREWKRTLPGVNFAQADKFYDEASRLGTERS